MSRMRRVSALCLVIAGLGGFFSVACKRPLSPEKDMASRVTGTWEWKQPKVAQPTVIVLELTAGGRYTETTYRETGGQRRVLYLKRVTGDLAAEPASADEIAKLKKSGFVPAVETGRFRVAVAEKTQTIVFESDRATGSKEQPLIIHSVNQITIAGQNYQRQSAATPPK
jgi:hypothetical protein